MEIKEIEVVLRCKNDVCVGALFVNFTINALIYMWFVLDFTVGITRLLHYRLAFHCWLLIFLWSIFITFEGLIYYICGQLFTGNAISNGNSTKAKTGMPAKRSSHFKLD